MVIEEAAAKQKVLHMKNRFIDERNVIKDANMSDAALSL